MSFFGEIENPVTSLRFEEIIPSEAGKGVYNYYIRSIRKTAFDADLLTFRRKALAGTLSPSDSTAMNGLLEKIKDNARSVETNRFETYARLKSCAMFMAQVLFVNYMINEGLLSLLPEKVKTDVLTKLSKYIDTCATRNESNLHADETAFYATLFTLQSLFNKHFVPDEDIVSYDTETGEYRVTAQYKRATAYLELTNRQVIHASPEEKELCFNITTGWGEHIDHDTWNQLNRYYYKEGSYTIDEGNLFTSNYDQILERMLPQFALSKVKCAEEVLKQEYNAVSENNKNQRLRIIEIGAGSGAFAIDLFMACKRLNIDVSHIQYSGLEPSDHMIGNFRKNMALKIGAETLPAEWKLEKGDVESYTKNPTAYSGNLTDNEKTIIVFSYSGHHCYHKSLYRFYTNANVRRNTHRVYFLDVTKEHGWTKPYYMWVDCESPENFNNVSEKGEIGEWKREPLWLEPDLAIEDTAVTNAWCCLKKLTPVSID